jgi:protoporphyrinogen oxidase
MNIVIIGAGPAGLTAALELQAAGIKDITVLEAAPQVGGISRTVNHNGNRIDIGGHRFFSKSDWVMAWWQDLLPVAAPSGDDPRELRYQGARRTDLPTGSASEADKDVMLLRSRQSRIYFNKRFFDYPLKINLDSLLKLGPWKSFTFGLSYIRARLNPIRPETSLRDFMVNRFGWRLYRQFFKEYTEKVWGAPCSEISAAWGAQRIKSLSITKAVAHALRNAVGKDARQAEQTSLIESFLYPKFGPGQMWETAAQRFTENGGTLLMQCRVERIDIDGGKVRSVEYLDACAERHEIACTHLLSTMPIKDLVAACTDAWPAEIRDIALGLSYRDFITVGLLYPKQAIRQQLDDNWIYIQEPGVNVGRVQVFNNWSPYMVADPDTVWLGLEFFCHEGDPLWDLPDTELQAMAHREMVEIGLADAVNPSDAVVIRVPKAYPGYFGEAYQSFDALQGALDAVENLFLIGRNGMHRYNNQDHSMLTAKEAARQIAANEIDKAAIWAINVDDEYHEEK